MAAEVPESDTLNSTDRRYLPRWEINNRVLYRLDDHGQTYIGCLKDLSSSGACVHVDQNLPLNQKLNLTIRLSEVRIVNVEGKVVWNDDIKNHHYIGIHFQNVTDHAQQLILDHAFELNHEEVVNHWFKGWEGKNDSLS